MTAAKNRSAARCLPPPPCVADLSRAPQQLARVLNLVARGGRITKFLQKVPVKYPQKVLTRLDCMIQTQTNDSSRIPIVHQLSPISVPLQSMLHSALLAFAAELDRGDAGGAVFCLDVQDHCAILDLASVRRGWWYDGWRDDLGVVSSPPPDDDCSGGCFVATRILKSLVI